MLSCRQPSCTTLPGDEWDKSMREAPPDKTQPRHWTEARDCRLPRHPPGQNRVVACFCIKAQYSQYRRVKKVTLSYLYRVNDPWLFCSTVLTGLHSLQLASADLLRERCMRLQRYRLHKQGLPLPTACQTLRSPRLVHHNTDSISFDFLFALCPQMLESVLGTICRMTTELIAR